MAGSPAEWDVGLVCSLSIYGCANREEWYPQTMAQSHSPSFPQDGPWEAPFLELLALFVNHLVGVFLLHPYTSTTNLGSFLFLFMFDLSERQQMSDESSRRWRPLVSQSWVALGSQTLLSSEHYRFVQPVK